MKSNILSSHFLKKGNQMSKNNEIEAKIILPEKTYRQLCADLNIKSRFNQENYYFDTNDALLQKNDISCRIRLFATHAEQTLKVPNSHPIQQKYHEAVEINDNLVLNDAKKLVELDGKSEPINFSGHVGQFLQSHFDAANKLRLQTFSKTNRILAEGPRSCELTFDANQYPDGYKDFELEIENPDPALIKTVLAELTKKYHIIQNDSNTNQAKIARAFKHRVKI